MVDDALWQRTAREALPGLYKLAISMLRQEADAQDAVQNALMKSWAARSRVQPEACRVYLTRIVINECRNIQRARMRTVPVEDFPDVPAPEREDLTEVAEAIAALPEKLRLPLLLKYLQGFSEQEGARALRVPVTTFRSRLHRARTTLRERLRAEWMEDEPAAEYGKEAGRK